MSIDYPQVGSIKIDMVKYEKTIVESGA